MWNDLLQLFKFLCILLILGISVLPLCFKLFHKFENRGFIFSGIIGLYLSGYLMWFFSSCHILKFGVGTSWFCVILITVLNYSYVFWKYKKGDNSFFEELRASFRYMLIEGLVFAFLFVLVCIIYAYRVPSYGTERFMDLGFMMSIARTEYMPAADIWCAGKSINYYYFGQYIFTFAGKLAFIDMGYAYTFGLYAVMAFALVGIFALVRNISKSRIAGIISSCAVVCAGSFHFIVFKYLVPAVWEMLQLEGPAPNYWFANSTRYIGYIPEVANDHTIHEFPAYSFIVGDLHAHVVNMMAVICILAILWAWLQDSDSLSDSWLKNMLDLKIACLGFLIGISFMANSWDFMIYFVVSGSIILFGLIRHFGKDNTAGYTKPVRCKKIIGNTAAIGAFVVIITLAVALPFSLNFKTMTEGLGIAYTHTRWYQFLILWGFDLIMTALFTALIIRLKKLTLSALYVLLLLLCATGLIFMPEFIFVKDIYIDGFPRANTMFKLTFEAFIMFGLCSGYIVNFFHTQAKAEEEMYYRKKYRRTATGLLICIAMLSGYIFMATRMWLNDGGNKGYLSMDAAYSIRLENQTEMGAIDSLTDQVADTGELQPVVLQADGDSYSNSCYVSVLTGFPTVMGWRTHEWLWNNSYNFYELRAGDIKDIYTGTDSMRAKSLLDKYNVDYIYIGPREYEKYGTVENGVLETLGEIIFLAVGDNGQIIEIIKID
ncbi:MAG: hypothetical protein K6G69_01810 [Lachnospiraceae bacterium]|nr:hypothetical protein [Lachnospiraceae bacterium]